MKSLITLLALITLPSTIFANTGSLGGSGGGRNIIYDHNPWFMGTEVVTWCVDINPELNNFSLTLEEAQIAIENGINIIASQLKSINQHNSEDKSGLKYVDGKWKQKTNYFPTDLSVKQISDSFEYKGKCSDAGPGVDITFILGNYKNSNITEYTATELERQKLTSYVAFAQLIDYSESNLRGKGFVYIAPDSGDEKYQYSGPKNIGYKRDDSKNTYWSNYKDMSKDTLCPKNLKVNLGYNGEIDPEVKLHDYSMGILTPVIVHEVGHILGLQHTIHKNIMHEDYPANLVRDGLEFKGNFLRQSKVLSRGLMETDIDRRIGFEFDDIIPFDLNQKAPNIQRLLNFDLNGGSLERYFIFDLAQDSVVGNYFNKASREGLTYHFQRAIPINIEEFQTEGADIKPCVDSSKDPIENTIKLRLDNENKEEFSLINLRNKTICGSTKGVKFKLQHNYSKDLSSLTLTDNKTNYSYTMHFKDSDILTIPEILGNPAKNASLITPVFHFDYSGGN